MERVEKIGNLIQLINSTNTMIDYMKVMITVATKRDSESSIIDDMRESIETEKEFLGDLYMELEFLRAKEVVD